MTIEEIDKQELARLCVQAMHSSSDMTSFEKLIRSCRGLGQHLMLTHNITPPTERRMIYKRFDGSGAISLQRTIPEFCSYGRRLDRVIERARVQQAKTVNLAILYDDSNSMTARWRNKHFSYAQIPEEQSPQTSAKIACLALMEAFAQGAEVSVVTFGSGVDGPLMARGNLHRKLVEKNGSGGTRMDLALKKLITTRWISKPGIKILVILTDGLPETGKRIAKIDTIIQSRTLMYVKQMLESGVRVLYVPLFLDKKLMYLKIGDYNAKSFADKVGQMGVGVVEVYDLDDIFDSMFEGIKTISMEITAEQRRQLMRIGGTI